MTVEESGAVKLELKSQEVKDAEYMQLIADHVHLKKVYVNLSKQHVTALKVIAELEDKVEKWDNIFDPNQVVVTEAEFNELLLNRGKLEAVKTWFREYADMKIEKFDHPWRKLEKILEAGA